MEGWSDSPLPLAVPAALTLTSVVVSVWRSRTKMSVAPLASLVTRSLATLSKTTKRPPSLERGDLDVLLPEPMAAELMLTSSTNSVACAAAVTETHSAASSGAQTRVSPSKVERKRAALISRGFISRLLSFYGHDARPACLLFSVCCHACGRGVSRRRPKTSYTGGITLFPAAVNIRRT